MLVPQNVKDKGSLGSRANFRLPVLVDFARLTLGLRMMFGCTASGEGKDSGQNIHSTRLIIQEIN